MSESSKIESKNIIGSSKDRIHAHNQSGIHSAECKCCGENLCGPNQTCIEKLFQRTSKPNNNKYEIENGHNFDLSNFRLIREVDKFYEFKALESFYVHKIENNLMNENDGPFKNSI